MTANTNDMTFIIPGNAMTSTPTVANKTKPSIFGAAASDPQAAKPQGMNLFGSAPSQPPSSFGIPAVQPPPLFGSAATQPPPPSFGSAATQPPPLSTGLAAQPPADANKAPASSLFGGKTTTSPAQPPPSFGGFGGGAASSISFGGSTNNTNAKPSFGLGGSGSPFGSTTAVSDVKPINNQQQHPQQQQQTSDNAPAADINQPFLTVSNAYTNPPTNAPKQHGQSNDNQTTSAGNVGDDDKLLRKIIAEEIVAFEQDLAQMLDRSRDINLDLGTKDELAATAKQLDELQDISGQATETTDTLTLEIQSLRLALNETFAMMTEAQTKRSMFINKE